MRIDKPVYCVQINREIHKYIGIPVNTDLHRSFVRAIAIATVRPLYAGHAQVVECFHNDNSFLAELRELTRLGFFVSLSKYPSLADFIDSRRQMYEWDKTSYPMYFETSLDALANFPTQSQGDPNTTEILRGVYGTLYRDGIPSFENRLNLEERRLIENASAEIRRHATNEEGAITAAFFRRSPLIQPHRNLDRVLSKILPYQFTNIYCDVFAAVTPTGFPHLSFFEDKQSFPYLDFDVMVSLLAKLGLDNLVIDHNGASTRRFLDFKTHPNFYEFVKSRDNLLYLLYEQSGRGLSSDRMDLLTNLRTLQVTQVEKTDDPFFAAAELYRTSEQLCSKVPAAAGRRARMADAQSWKGKYLVMTATDSEDHALRNEFTSRGFTSPIVRNSERFSYGEYFRSDIGRVFHVRTSAGSGGASGSFVMGKNAIEFLNPEYVISVGICFGLHEGKQNIGDIIVSEHVHDYERFRVSETRPEDRGATREAAPVLLSRARATLAIWKGATVHFGTIVSGEKLVDDRSFRDFLLTLRPAPIAGDMEAWGLSAVCHEMRKQFIMVKGICDWAVNKTSDHQSLAAANACKFVFDALVVA